MISVYDEAKYGLVQIKPLDVVWAHFELSGVYEQARLLN